MSKLIPMPSPRGTNRARLFLSPKFGRNTAVVAAYDSAEGLESSVIEDVLEFLEGKLEEDDLADVKTLLTGDTADADWEAFRERWKNARNRRARDKRAPDRKAQDGPRPGGAKVGMDGAQRGIAGFLERFPDARRLRAW